MKNRIAGPIIGALVGTALDKLADLSREAIAAAMRDVADKVERGDIVSDEALAQAKAATARLRDLIDRAPKG